MKKSVKITFLIMVLILILFCTYNNFKKFNKIIVQYPETASEMAELLAQAHFQSTNEMPFKTISKGKYWVSTLDLYQYVDEAYGEELVTVDLDCRVVIQKTNGKILLIDGNVIPLRKAVAIADKNKNIVDIDKNMAIDIAKIILKDYIHLKESDISAIDGTLNGNFWELTFKITSNKQYNISINRHNGTIKIK